MEKKQLKILSLIGILLVSLVYPLHTEAKQSDEETKVQKVVFHSGNQMKLQSRELPDPVPRFVYDSGFDFEYPDAVRGIYVTGPSAGGSRFEKLLKLVDETDLNSMVIDIKEDAGILTFKPEEGSPYEDVGINYIKDVREVLKTLEKHDIYPIARVVVFKDSKLAKKRPDLSFTKNGQVWENGKGESFVNPFLKEVWDYNVEVAKMAAKMGFKDIQFDYVRFPEGFEKRDDVLNYDQGKYKDLELDDVQKRVTAVTDFVEYARKELEYYGVDVSVDIFGYSATIPEAPGIGQNFTKISKNVDVISSMIYPSHWTSYFGIPFPDKEPYRLVTEYAKVENERLGELEDPPTSRPWIQDFSAPWLYYNEPTKYYDKEDVEAQIRALNENGIQEFLLWNPLNSYSENVDYTPLDKES
ncbi:putative glycoside hydrolase [Pontibacillus sp. HMF3514]|uniref:putative glycoside hydrolase n=1 Tax=Pontibacillus sp. HMF3514 TaxID=2692425 RepID=UPI0013202102|nr:putative glycoside hydrolase [Pontibacillus sp. HMF3514]QHE51461.1 GTP-binding protein [Pontibacillus sp. HMF3514]